MVARSDDAGDCGHGHECDACRFRAGLARHIDRMSGGGERAWILGAGELVEALLLAAAALHEARRHRFTEDAAANAPALAAEALVGVWHELERLRAELTRK